MSARHTRGRLAPLTLEQRAARDARRLRRLERVADRDREAQVDRAAERLRAMGVEVVERGR